jgi:hypothetical protein
MSNSQNVSIVYNITRANGELMSFSIDLDPDTLAIIQPRINEGAEWTLIGNCRCPNCTLDPALNRHCPTAANMGQLMDFLKDAISYENVTVEVVTNERTIIKETQLQAVASSLMGIIMVASGCPILSRLRPMVEFHLPFASWHETTYRMVTMYLFAQYFIYKKGGHPDWDMKHLVALFEDVKRVNVAFCRRLDSVRTNDASVNAVNVLSNLGMLAQMTVEGNAMQHWENIFATYFADHADGT